MKKDISQNLWIMVLCIVTMILISIYMLYHSAKTYNDYDRKQEDQALDSILTSVDSSIISIANGYYRELSYVVKEKDFQEAEDKWLSSGQAEDLLFRMKSNILGNDSEIETIIALFRGHLILSTNNKMDYLLSVSDDTENSLDLVVCTDGEMNSHIAFVQRRGQMTYAVLMDPVVFYEKIEHISGLRSMGDMILMDHDRSMFLYREQDQVVEDIVDDEGELDSPLLQIMNYAHNKQTQSIDFYEVSEGPYKDTYQARVAVCPDDQSQNASFSIGILHNENERNTMLRIALAKVLTYMGIIALGIAILLYLLFQSYLQNMKARKEMTILIAKKEAMEALNEQSKIFAHHQRLETIGQLTAGVAHEFNNLLTPIMGYSLMTMEQLPPEAEDIYDNQLEIYDAAQKAKELISRLSDLSRKNTSETMRSVNPNTMLVKAISMANTSKPKPISLETDLTCQDVTLHGNETQLVQMIINLIINAFHAIGDDLAGKVIIRDYVKDGRICIEIQDDGEGMTEEVKKKLFEPFFTTKKEGRGTGLGLAIAQQTVEAHKGSISVQSKLGEGSTFLLEFPIEEE